jgi:UDP-glucuronate 4-epimerase
VKILVTGTAGFIGFHLANRLLNDGYEVIGIDSINSYYDVNLKYARLAEAGIRQNEITYAKSIESKKFQSYTFNQAKLEDKDVLEKIFEKEQPNIVIHLAAQAGVRYSLINPGAYISSNIEGFMNVLECCRHFNTNHLLYASSSSVYGLNDEIPFSESQNTDHPASIYAATKKSNELMAHAYSYLFNLPATGLRFFTAYGTWGRPDMALFIFTKSILEGKPIQLFNYGNMMRDFTYVDDVVEAVIRIMQNPPDGGPGSPNKIYNIGNNAPVKLSEFVEAIEAVLGIKAEKELLPLQPGDVPATYADVTEFVNDFGYKPTTPVKEGVKKFIDWYKKYYKVD